MIVLSDDSFSVTSEVTGECAVDATIDSGIEGCDSEAALVPTDLEVIAGYAPSVASINAYRSAVAAAAKAAGATPVADTPLTIEIDFVFSRPKSHFNKSGLKPKAPALPRADITNCVKGVEDALNGVAYVDDRQLCSVTATKSWGDEGSTRVRIV